MSGNVVAGAERVGIRTSGQSCSAPSVVHWSNNVVHSSLIGVAISPSFWQRYGVPLKGGTKPCTLINGFTIWRSSHEGIYLNVSEPVVVVVVVVVVDVISDVVSVFVVERLPHK